MRKLLASLCCCFFLLAGCQNANASSADAETIKQQSERVNLLITEVQNGWLIGTATKDNNTVAPGTSLSILNYQEVYQAQVLPGEELSIYFTETADLSKGIEPVLIEPRS